VNESVDCVRTDKVNRSVWNKAHEDRCRKSLSGSDPRRVLEQHCAATQIRAGMVVLDIGVGLGEMCRYLCDVGCVVDALDIADRSEDTVYGLVRNFYLADEIERLPSREYELAISHIVSQHMCERNLRRQIAEVSRSTKLGGLFSIQFAGAVEGPLNNLGCEIAPGSDGSMCRSPNYTLAMITEVLDLEAYAVTLVGDRIDWPRFGSYWYFIHIHPKGAKQ
jgi:SAM-dependent methyltransferase